MQCFNPGEYVFVLKGLTCPNCANLIVTNLRQQSAVVEADIELFSSRLYLKVKTAKDWQTEVQTIVNKYEPDIRVENIATASDTLAENDKSFWLENWQCLLGGFLLILAYIGSSLLSDFKWLEQVFLYTALIILARPLLPKVYHNFKNGNYFDEISLMLLAIFGAIGLGEIYEAVMVLLLYEIGELLQSKAVGRASKNWQKVWDLQPQNTRIVTANGSKLVSTATIAIGTEIVVQVGEVVPLDAINEHTISVLNQQSLTGESMPQHIEAGELIKAGSIVMQQGLRLRTVATQQNSAISHLINLTVTNRLQKAKTESFLNRLAHVYTPIVAFLALGMAIIPWLLGADVGFWWHQALVVLVLACPCAIVLAVPLAYVQAIGRAAKADILIKGGKFLESINKCDMVLFDKTGTLTTGQFVLQKINILQPTYHSLTGDGDYFISNSLENNVDKLTVSEIIKISYVLEQYSSHPLAKAVRKLARELKIELPSDALDLVVTETAGVGVKAMFQGREWQLGSSEKLMLTDLDIQTQDNYTSLVLTKDSIPVAILTFSDETRSEAGAVIKNLQQVWHKQVGILSGDKKETVRLLAADLAVDRWYSSLMPADKTAIIKENLQDGHRVVYLGDGINDAPALALANVSIAMGGATEAAMESADIIFMKPTLDKLHLTLALAQELNFKVKFNIALSLGFKILLFILGMFTVLPLWLAVLGDSGVAVVVVLHSIYNYRLPKFKL